MIDDNEKTTLDVDIFLTKSENAVYIRLGGFPSYEDANNYADYLVDYLPLMLFESKTLH